MSGTRDSDEYEEEDEPRNWKLLILGIVVVIGVLVGIAYFELSYERGVVSTSIGTGKITAIKGNPVNTGGNNQNLPGVPANNGQSLGTTTITVSFNSTSFTQDLGCLSPPYRVGQSVQFDVNILRSGQVRYIADLACKGSPSPFVTTTSQTSSTSHA